MGKYKGRDCARLWYSVVGKKKALLSNIMI